MKIGTNEMGMNDSEMSLSSNIEVRPVDTGDIFSSEIAY